MAGEEGHGPAARECGWAAAHRWECGMGIEATLRSMGMNEEESVRLAGVVGSVSLDGSDKSRKKKTISGCAGFCRENVFGCVASGLDCIECQSFQFR